MNWTQYRHIMRTKLRDVLLNKTRSLKRPHEMYLPHHTQINFLVYDNLNTTKHKTKSIIKNGFHD